MDEDQASGNSSEFRSRDIPLCNINRDEHLTDVHLQGANSRHGISFQQRRRFTCFVGARPADTHVGCQGGTRSLEPVRGYNSAGFWVRSSEFKIDIVLLDRAVSPVCSNKGPARLVVQV